MQIAHDDFFNAKNALIFIDYEGVLSTQSKVPNSSVL
jgi:trehalose-6-phosphatase